MNIPALFETLDVPNGAATQQPFSVGHLDWPAEPQPLVGEISRLATMNAAFADMVATVGTDAFDDAHRRFVAARAEEMGV